MSLLDQAPATAAPETLDAAPEAPDAPEYLDLLFGDPTREDNPTGFAAFLAADERRQLLHPAERLLDRANLDAEFVPARLGGRLTSADRLARVLRPLFARDAALGLSHGTSNLIAAVTVWVAGSPEQQRRAADVLLGNGWIAPAYTDVDTGNDIRRTRLAATWDGDRVLLDGAKQMINNLERADLFTVLARTGTGDASRDHSLFLLDRAALPRDRVRWHPRYRTAGVRGLPLAGMDLDDCPVPASSLVGERGGAMETVMRGFQVTRSVLPSAAIGAWDVQLRVVLDFIRSRRLYGGPATDLPLVQRQLTGTFVDLLVADAMSTASCRALHLLPGHTACYAPAVKYVVPTLLADSVEELAVVLGARSFLRDGPHAVFQKHLRDLPVATLVHSGGTVCLATIIPQLPRLARSWPDGGTELPVGVLDPAQPLPELALDRLRIVPASGDPLLGVLARERDGLPDPRARLLVDALLAEVTALRADVRALRPAQTTLLAPPVAFDLARRYVLLLAAAACVGTYRHRSVLRTGDPQDDAAWLLLALARLAHRLGVAVEPGPDDDAWGALWRCLLARHDAARAFDLTARPVVHGTT